MISEVIENEFKKRNESAQSYDSTDITKILSGHSASVFSNVVYQSVVTVV